MALDLEPGKLARNGPRKKIVIIGAGMAGLSAGLELTRAGHDVEILEAQNHAGGRVRTIRNPFSSGLYAEAGAARIPETHTLTLNYAKDFGLELSAFEPVEIPSTVHLDGFNYRSDNPAILEILGCSAEEQRLGSGRALLDRTISARRELGDPDQHDWPSSQAIKFDELNGAKLFKQLGLSEGMVRFMDLGFGVLGELSGLDLLLQLESLSARKFRIVNGNDLLPKAMANTLIEKIRFNMPVNSISQSRTGVEIKCSNQYGSQSFYGDHVIVTVPLPILDTIDFAPGLSNNKTQAIRSTRYAAVSRLFVQLEKQFWKEQGISGFAVSDHPLEIFDSSFGQQTTKGLLLAYLHEDTARQFDAAEPQQASESVLKMMMEIFPEISGHVERTASYSWQKDPWARGAIALWQPGDFSSIYPYLSEREGVIHFAGEHCSPWHSWIHGAIHSGLRAALEVNEA